LAWALVSALGQGSLFMIDGQPRHLRREMNLSRFLQCSSAQAEPDYDALLHSGQSRFPRVNSKNDRAVSLCATDLPTTLSLYTTGLTQCSLSSDCAYSVTFRLST
jgi:hypothetical protein